MNDVKAMNEVTIEMIELMNNEFGYEFVTENGMITKVCSEDGKILDC